MTTLSARLQTPGIFTQLFNSFFPANTFDKDNILSYISACNKAILEEVSRAFPDHKIQFINPVFVMDGTIYPPVVLHGNERVIALAHANMELIRKQEVLPVSLPLINNKIAGVCLYMGAGVAYDAYPSMDLNALTSMPLPFNDKTTEAAMVAMGEMITVNANALPAIFHTLAETLGVSAIEDKVKLAKNLLLYKYFFNGVSEAPAYLSFVSSAADTHSFFDCLFTVVSEQAFTEAQLNDFRKVIADMTAPLEAYYAESQKQAHNDKKAALLQRELLNSLRGVAQEQQENKVER